MVSFPCAASRTCLRWTAVSWPVHWLCWMDPSLQDDERGFHVEIKVTWTCFPSIVKGTSQFWAFSFEMELYFTLLTLMSMFAIFSCSSLKCKKPTDVCKCVTNQGTIDISPLNNPGAAKYGLFLLLAWPKVCSYNCFKDRQRVWQFLSNFSFPGIS